VFRTIREQIADRIRADVISGRLAAGSSLREQALAEQYGVSRAPIRDALLQLTQEGLLVAKPNCGVRVASSSGEELQPLVVDLRRRIEVFALREVFGKLTDADVQRMQDTVQRLKVACEDEDLAEIVQQDMALHRCIVEATGSPDLLAMWLPIVSRMLLHYSRHRNMMESYREHAAIVDAIRKKDKKAAIKALTANIQ
jgi:DNA-binding GntR family transcriptional regulator